MANKGVLNLPIAGKDEEDLFESARIYIESSGRPFNYLPTEEEVSQDIRERRAQQSVRKATSEIRQDVKGFRPGTYIYISSVPTAYIILYITI